LFGLVGLVGSELDHLFGAAPRDGADELAGVEDLQQAGVEPDGDDLAGEVSAGWDLLVAHPMRPLVDTLRVISVGLRMTGWEGWMVGEGTAASGWKRLAGTTMAMAWWGGGGCRRPPRLQDLLGVVERVEAAAGQLGWQGLVEPFDLAGGGGGTDPGEPVGDAVLAADAVEQDLGRVGAEAPGEDVAVEFLIGVKSGWMS
jgi:hypothetical protein